MALFKYFTRQEKPTNSGTLLTKTEVEEADKAVAKVLEPTSKTGASRGKYNSYTSVQRGRLFRGVKLESTQRKMVRQVLQSIFPQNGTLV